MHAFSVEVSGLAVAQSCMLLPQMLSDLVSTTVAGATRLNTSSNRAMVTLKMEVNRVSVAPEIRTAFKRLVAAWPCAVMMEGGGLGVHLEAGLV